MKRFLALLLSLCAMASTAVPAYALEYTIHAPGDGKRLPVDHYAILHASTASGATLL